MDDLVYKSIMYGLRLTRVRTLTPVGTLAIYAVTPPDSYLAPNETNN